MAQDDGISHGLRPVQAVAMTMSAFAAVALYNVMELAFIIAITFKKRKGLYFWSFIVATAGILPYTLGFMFKFFSVIPQTMISITLIAIGWCCMVTGQSVVLYSRLHLVVRNFKILRWVLIMIIVNAVICHVPIIVLVYGANSNNPSPFSTLYSIYEKVQITIFFLQELIISGLYVFSAAKVLKPVGNIKGKNIRTAMTHLIYINIVVVFFDLTLLATEYAGHYEIQVLYKAVLYSIKLKLEFRILNQLLEFTQASGPRNWSNDCTLRNLDSTLNMDTLSSNHKVTHFQGHVPPSNYNAHISCGDGALRQDLKGVLKTEELVIEQSERVPSSECDSEIGNESVITCGNTVKETDKVFV
jgi:hypothetical protein